MRFYSFVILIFVTVLTFPLAHFQNAVLAWNFDETIKGTINPGYSTQETYEFQYNFDINQQWAIYVCVNSTQATVDHPLLVSVRQTLGILSWSVPQVKLYSSVPRTKVCHTICPLQNYVAGNVKEVRQTIYVNLYASRHAQITPFWLRLENVTNFLIGKNEEDSASLNITSEPENWISLNITQSQPRVLEYHMPDGVDSVLIETRSEERRCIVMSIQNISCPLFDSEETVLYKGFHQSMTLKGGITISRKDFKDGKLYIVMILKPSPGDCAALGTGTVKVKPIRININPAILNRDFDIAVGGVAGIYLAMCLIFIIVYAIVWRRGNKNATACVDGETGKLTTATAPSKRSKRKAKAKAQAESSADSNAHQVPLRNASVQTSALSILDMLDARKEMDKIFTKDVVYVSDLDHITKHELCHKSKTYSWNVFVLGIFYVLPAFQLAFINQEIVNLTGNQDICYRNFLCAHRAGIFSDFNHVFSNIGYMILGALFLILVWIRQVNVDENENHKMGIPHHFGIFYAMGWALVLEGVMSAVYHICPNKANFQFDTTFMYIICTVCIVKIYHSRHPAITAKSHHIWFVIAIILIVAVIGVFEESIGFWVAFVIIHVSITLVVFTAIYYNGRLKLDRRLPKRIWKHLAQKVSSHSSSIWPKSGRRLFLLCVAMALNVGMDIYAIIDKLNPPTLLLYIFIANLVLYLLYYGLVKLFSKEQMNWCAIFYLVLSIAFWIVGILYYAKKKMKWELTPAHSRENNDYCLVGNFYDEHDVWHFASSFALFFSFMSLLVFDDDLKDKSRSRIKVF